MYKLGYNFDLGVMNAPVDLSGGAVTGKRVNLRNAQSVAFVVFKGAESTGTDDPVLTLNQWSVSTSGSASALNVDHYWAKSATALAGTESWSKVSMASGRTVTLTGLATKQAIVVVEVNTKDLTDGFDYVSIDTADAGSTAQIGGILAILTDLTVRRDPANMAPTLF
jgi:hypothetical protein